MAEVYPFTENSDHEIFNYKQPANILSSTRQQINYDHRFTQVNAFSRAATNCVANYSAVNSVPKIFGYEGVDILLKPRLINTYLAQSIITGYKLQGIHGIYLQIISE
jgi:predicted ATP-grasp superfamily ATP-dependent carboligase